ncbi:MAG: hypothetical protein JXR37_09925 [Kiritimatiellae bacterium]|nr:hypothetical protein [Kiritimatiellia bacterium]
MADITIKCEECGKSITVSEYVDASSLTCSACGKRLRMPAGAGMMPTAPSQDSPETHTRHHLKRPDAPLKTVVSALPQPSGQHQPQFDPTKAVRMRAHEKEKGKSALPAWGLFVLLTFIVCYVRYLPQLSPATLGSFADYVIPIPEHVMYRIRQAGLIFIAIIYVSGILLAWKDEMFQGILCTVVPFYPLYYILFVADIFILRAILGALLLGFAQDLAFFLGSMWSNICAQVDAWIMGEKVKNVNPLLK